MKYNMGLQFVAPHIAEKTKLLTYKSSYKSLQGTFLGSVLDYPGAIAYGRSLDEARENLASALLDMAETSLLKGEALPIPNSKVTDQDADLEEPIHLVLQTGHHVSLKVGVA